MTEVHSFKWPRHLQAVTRTHNLGEDRFGRWLGVRRGDPWQRADGSHGGVFAQPLVKLVPTGTFWTACFHPVDPVVDVDIVLPVQWADGRLEEVDLELDILRTAKGQVTVRDEDLFAHIWKTEALPDALARQALAACVELHRRVAQAIEPFDAVGRGWLTRFIAGTETP